MKKKILFIVSNLESGGVQKSLVSLLSCFDFDKYNVDLLLLNPYGLFKPFVPKNVNVLNQIMPSDFFIHFPQSIKSLWRKKEIALIFQRTFQFVLSRFDRGIGGVYMARCMPELDKKYHAVIDYGGQHCLYYMIDKLNAEKKITYFHNDYSKWSYYYKADRKYYPKADYIVTVSPLCQKSIDDNFPECSPKTRVIHNIISPKVIHNLAAEEGGFSKEAFDGVRILTVGHPCQRKGYDFAIKACALLKQRGYKIRWYSIGISPEIENYKRLAKQYGVENEFIFLGEQANPYNYMKQADIYVHPSRFEGKAIAIDEAKILCKPIVVTDFSTASDQIENENNGLIVKMGEQSLFEGIKRLIENPTLMDKMINNLTQQCIGNEDERKKLYELIES